MNLFVANISREVSENALKALFSEFGEVTSVKIVIDRTTGFSKGFGFVEMQNEHAAAIAIKKLTHANFFGMTLMVTKARPKTSVH
ncbi:MAG TPA: RNA-binding protein [Ohtaekwangia sp.]